jgi:hypothetical protein
VTAHWWVVNSDGSALRRLTQPPTVTDELAVASVPLLWTADSLQLVVRRPDGVRFLSV